MDLTGLLQVWYPLELSIPNIQYIVHERTNANCSHSDSVASRTLERRVDLSNVTVEACIKECLIQSFTIAGLEYAQECCKLLPMFSFFFFPCGVGEGLINRFFFQTKGVVMR